jgi:hypothetical protein
VENDCKKVMADTPSVGFFLLSTRCWIGISREKIMHKGAGKRIYIPSTFVIQQRKSDNVQLFGVGGKTKMSSMVESTAPTKNLVHKQEWKTSIQLIFDKAICG